MKIGVSGLAVGNHAGLGRLARIYIIALASASAAHEVHLYLRRPADLEWLERECDKRNGGKLDRLVLHYPPLGGLNRLILEELLLPRTFRPLELDCYLGLDFTLPPVQLAPTEAVVVPDLLPFTRPRTVSWRARWLYRRGIARCVRRGARLLCISRATRDTLVGLYPEMRNARVVYPAISPGLLARATKVHDAAKAVQVRGSLHGFSARSGYLLSVGVTGPRKNTDLLVQTYREVVAEGEYSGPLVLVGGDGRYHHVRPQPTVALEPAGAPMNSREAGVGIYDIGAVSDHELSDLYHGADLLVSFSAEEGFGFPVLEALAHGTPALVTAGSSMLEIAPGGIVWTKLAADARARSLVSAIHALPVLRRETAKLDIEQYTIERLGAELLAALEGDANAAN